MKASDLQIGRRKRAFSLLELLAILGVVSSLMLFGATVVLVQGHRKWQRVVCVNTLKNVGLGVRIYETETVTNGTLPFRGVSNSPKNYDDFVFSLRAMSNELSTPWILACTADSRRPVRDWKHLTRTNISYFFNLSAAETFPQSILAADRNVLTNGVRLGPGIVKLGVTATNVAWDGSIHRFQGNALMGDGSVQQLSLTKLREQWTNQKVSPVTLAVP